MDKREFMEKYVLNRARASKEGLNGDDAAKEAERAHDYIVEAAKRPAKKQEDR